MKKIYTLLLISFFQFAIPQIAQADASCNIGKILYEKGEYVRAFKHMKTLARYSNPCAEFYLGVMYSLGRGTNKNTKLASKYIHRAAKGKYLPALTYYDEMG